MEKHVTLVGALHIGYSALQLLGGLIALLFIIGGGLLGGLISEEEIVISIVFFIAGAIGTWMALVSLPGIIAGVGVLRHRPWGRYMVLVLAVIWLFNIPLGTAIGAYSLWVLIQDETAKLFASGGA
jgi:hypothetical protein